MTTGRINQVTILSERTNVRTQPPEGSELYQARRRRSDPSRYSEKTKSPNSVPTDSIAPTEFPKGRSTASHVGCFHRYISAAYTPQEEKIYASSRTVVRKLSKTIPKDLMNIWQSQQSTNRKWCLPKIDRASDAAKPQATTKRQCCDVAGIVKPILPVKRIKRPLLVRKQD